MGEGVPVAFVFSIQLYHQALRITQLSWRQSEKLHPFSKLTSINDAPSIVLPFDLLVGQDPRVGINRVLPQCFRNSGWMAVANVKVKCIINSKHFLTKWTRNCFIQIAEMNSLVRLHKILLYIWQPPVWMKNNFQAIMNTSGVPEDHRDGEGHILTSMGQPGKL